MMKRKPFERFNSRRYVAVPEFLPESSPDT